MKSKLTFISSSFLAATVALPVWADTKAGAAVMPQKGHSEWAKKTDTSQKQPLGPITRAADVIGREVRNQQDEKLGQVEDLAIDTDSGRITQVIVSSGGFLGIGDSLHSVPPSAFQKTATTEPLRLDTTKEKFKNSPRFNMDRWDELSDANHVGETYRYYGVEPYFVEVRDGSRNDSEKSDRNSKHLGHLVRATKLNGMSVKNAAGETIGDVKDLLVDFHGGRVNQVLVSTGGFLGVADEVSVVPPGAFRFSNQDRHLVLDVSKEKLQNAPRYQPEKWVESQETSFIASVYDAFDVDPYFDPDAPIVWNRGDRADTADNSYRSNGKTAEDQSNNESDIEITRDIRRAIIAKDGFSMNAQNIKIITDDGEVTLKGPVSSQWEKKAIEDLAATIVDRAKIDNELTVSASSVAVR